MVNLTIDYVNIVFLEINFSNKRPCLTTAFLSNISLEIVRAIADTGGTNNIAAKLLLQRVVVYLQQFYSNSLQ